MCFFFTPGNQKLTPPTINYFPQRSWACTVGITAELVPRVLTEGAGA
tara:strand:- start:238 stop:378 length:141 start_codon:yes stop_codon:yes gene_type:complete